eukprot:403365851
MQDNQLKAQLEEANVSFPSNHDEKEINVPLISGQQVEEEEKESFPSNPTMNFKFIREQQMQAVVQMAPKQLDESDMSIEAYSWDCKEVLKFMFNLEASFKSLCQDYPKVLVNYNLDQNDQVYYELNTIHEDFNQVLIKIEDLKIIKECYILQYAFECENEILKYEFNDLFPQYQFEISQIWLEPETIQKDSSQIEVNFVFEKINEPKLQQQINFYAKKLNERSLYQILSDFKEFRIRNYRREYKFDFNDFIKEPVLREIQYNFFQESKKVKSIINANELEDKVEFTYYQLIIQDVSLDQINDLQTQFEQFLGRITISRQDICSKVILDETLYSKDRTIKDKVENKLDVKIYRNKEFFEEHKLNKDKLLLYDLYNPNINKIVRFEDEEQFLKNNKQKIEYIIVGEIEKPKFNTLKERFDTELQTEILPLLKDCCVLTDFMDISYIRFDFIKLKQYNKQHEETINQINAFNDEFIDAARQMRFEVTVLIPNPDYVGEQIFEISHRNQVTIEIMENPLQELQKRMTKFAIMGDTKQREKAFLELKELERDLQRQTVQENINDHRLVWSIKMLTVNYLHDKHSIRFTKNQTNLEEQQFDKLLKEMEKIHIKSQKSILKCQWQFKTFEKDGDRYTNREDKKNDFVDYEDAVSKQIEEHFQYCLRSGNFGPAIKLNISNHTYEIWGSSFLPSNWYQKNISSLYVRQLNRVVTEIFEFNKSEAEQQLLTQPEFQARAQLGLYTVEGRPDDMANLMKELLSYYECSENHYHTLPVKKYLKNWDIEFEKELVILFKEKYNLRLEFLYDELEAKIYGIKSKKGKKKLEKILEQQKLHQFPYKWDAIVKMIVSPAHTWMHQVDKASSEYNSVNKNHWIRYQQEKNRLKEKLDLQPTEKLLFHGTRDTDYMQILDSEDGFDTRFSKAGMWGYGIYLATQSHYVDTRGYVQKKGNIKTMFLLRALVGEAKKLEPDNTLKMPPLIPGSQTKRYDSVTGMTYGCQVYVIYSNGRVYPEYIINYFDY